CDKKITLPPHLGLATATTAFHVRVVSPPNVVPPKPRSASSEAFGRPVILPRQDGLFLSGPFLSDQSALPLAQLWYDGSPWCPPSSKCRVWLAGVAAG